MAERCTCCDLPVESCGRAAEKRQQRAEQEARAELLVTRGWFPARYPGSCAGCGSYFRVGEPIRVNRNRRWTEPVTYVASCCQP